MPRLARYKYTKLTALGDLLRDAPRIGRPRKIDTDWLESRGVLTNGGSIISVLRFVGLIRHDGTPTDLWDAISEPSLHNKVKFADAIRAAYDDLFALYPKAHREDDRTLSTFFQSQVQGQAAVQNAVLNTFRTLVKFGDFDTDAASLANRTIDLPELVQSVEVLERNAREWLDAQDKIQAKLVAIDPFRARLKELSLEHDELLRDGLTAAEAGLFRSSHVLAWSGFAEFLYKPFTISKVRTLRPKIITEDDLDRAPDFDLIQVGKELGFYNETTKKTLHGLLKDRNLCAPGSRYNPDLNETLGYLSKVLHVISDLQTVPNGPWT